MELHDYRLNAAARQVDVSIALRKAQRTGIAGEPRGRRKTWSGWASRTPWTAFSYGRASS